MNIFVNGKDISSRTGSPSRSDDVDGLSQSFSFVVAFNPNDRYFPNLDLNCGDKVVVSNNGKEIFKGTITDESRNGLFERTYTAHDNGWYLNKNEVVAQIKDMTADSAIKKLCDEFGIGTDICSMPTKINQIYDGTVLSDAIKDIVDKVSSDQAKSYRMEIVGDKLKISEYKNMIVKPSFKMASNVAPTDPTKAPAQNTVTKSIQDMANTVKVISSAEKSTTVEASAKDDKAIAKYGTLQKVVKRTDADKAQAGNIAKNTLLELNKVTEGKSVKLLGDDVVRSGRIIQMDGKYYLVTSCTHDYMPVHTMSLELEVVQ